MINIAELTERFLQLEERVRLLEETFKSESAERNKFYFRMGEVHGQISQEIKFMRAELRRHIDNAGSV